MIWYSRIITIIISCLSFFLQAQNNYTLYTTKDGLPHNTVACTFQDREGFLWIGTYAGLCRFDGSNFHNLPIGDKMSNQLAADIILDIEEKGDKLLVAHSFGLSIIDKYSLKCKNFTLPNIETYYNFKNAIHDIQIYKGKIWLGSSQGLYYFNEKLQTIENVSSNIKNDKNVNYGANFIIPTKDNKLLLLAGSGYYSYDTKKNTFNSTLLFDIPIEILKGKNIRVHRLWNSYKPELFLNINRSKQTVTISKINSNTAYSNVYNFYVNEKNDLFINTLNKTIILNKDDQWSKEEYLANSAIHFNSINETMLFGTFEGLMIKDKNNLGQYKINIKEVLGTKGIEIQGIKSCDAYHGNKLLISCIPGLYFFDYKTNEINRISLWKDSLIIKTFTSSPEKIYVTTNEWIYAYYPRKEKASRICRLNSYIVAIQAWKNKLIFATRSHGLFLIDKDNDYKEEFIPSNKQDTTFNTLRITDVLPYINQNEFIVTYNGTTRYSIINFNEKWRNNYHLKANIFKENEVFTLQTACLDDKAIWFGSYLGGILYKESHNDVWKNLTTTHGLYHNSISQLKYDGKKYVWAITRAGINVINVNTLSIKKFTNQILIENRPSLFIDSTNHLFFCDYNNLEIIDINNFELSENSKSLLISKIYQDSINLKNNKNFISLPYHKNYLKFEFSAFHYNQNLSYNYSYRLKNNEPWISIGNQTQLYLTNLEPGEYNLQLHVIDQFETSTINSEIIKIIILPPFWQTLWFKLLSLILLGLATWYIINLYINNKLEKDRLKQLAAKQERERLLADLHDDIGASLSSLHINSELAERIHETKPQMAKKLLNNISRESREISSKLSDFIWSIYQESNEKVNLKQRVIDYQQQLFVEKEIIFKFEIQDEYIPRDVNLLKNILLIIKEAMNNIAKYSEATEVNLILRKNVNEIELIIIDNGVGFDLSKTSNGNGLNNMEKRTKANKGNFYIKSEKGKGTEIKCIWGLS